MTRYLVIFINPLLLLSAFWFFFYSRTGFWWVLGFSLIVILLSGQIIARHYFFSFKNLWLNLSLAYLSQLLFLLLLSSVALRYWLALIFAFLWLVLWWFLKKHFDSRRVMENREYLSFNKFFYYLSFWFLSVAFYSFVFFLNFSIFNALLIFSLAAFFWAREIIKLREGGVLLPALFTSFLLLQAASAIYLLPLSFYVLGTTLTIFMFFILESLLGRLSLFRWYLGLFLLSFIVLLVSSIF
ncbi:MAG: hypothetical protein PHO91_00225 [Patescibacteria group bacterium]|nr:hypothetical protein [Patescibacteria group bacterium]